MKAPLSWLKEYVDIDVTAQELQEKLFSCGFEVEELVYVGGPVTNTVVGQITKIEKHPDADRLQVCTVDCGKYGVKQIVTAATNVFVGAKVPAALDGANLCNDIKIKTGKLRGVVSEGMFCSGEELGINDDQYPGAEVYGILILEEGAPLGEDIKKVIGTDDYIFDIAVTANRPDCQSIIGIAREVAAVLRKPFKMPDVTFPCGDKKTSETVSIEVKDSALCPRYIGTYVYDIKLEKSPLWLTRRLALCGLRSINNIVDITNYVLLEMGQPMHSFDLDDLEEKKIIVRRAENGEKIVTLDEKQFKLNENNLVICDGKKPVALAGIMGGLNSEIKPTTKEVLFETAKFARDNVRKTSRSLGQSSDSSSRYEKGMDAYSVDVARRRALNLVSVLGAGTIACDHVDVNADPMIKKVMKVSPEKINSLLGIVVPTQEMIAILKSLQFEVEFDESANEMQITVPLYRGDVDGYADIAEEVIREYGYDHIEDTFLAAAKVTTGGLTAEQKKNSAVKSALVNQGYSECIHYSFYSPKDLDMLHFAPDAPEREYIKILNPIGEDLSIMRTILAPSMVNAIVRNLRRSNYTGALFEVGNRYIPTERGKEVFASKDAEPKTDETKGEDSSVFLTERSTLSIGIFGDKYDFFNLKGAVEKVMQALGIKAKYVSVADYSLKAEKEGKTAKDVPYLHRGIAAAVLVGDKCVGYLGALAPDIAEELAIEKPVFIAEIEIDELEKMADMSIKYHPICKFPIVTRDLALVADENVTCAQVEETISSACKAVTDVKLFDVYRGEKLGSGKKSMAFTITFTPTDKAFEPEDVDKFIKKILNNLKFKSGIEIRE